MKKLNKILTASAFGTSSLALALFLGNQGFGNNVNQKIQYKVAKSNGVTLGLTEQESNALLAKVPKGVFNLGAIGHDFSEENNGREVREVVHSYTQDIKNKSLVGEHFFSLPTNFWLRRSPGHFEVDSKSIPVGVYEDYVKQLSNIRNFLNDMMIDEFVDQRTNGAATAALNGQIFVPRGAKSFLVDALELNPENSALLQGGAQGVGAYSKFVIELHKVLPASFTSTQLLAHFKTALQASGFDSHWEIDTNLRALTSIPSPIYQNISNGKKKITIFGAGNAQLSLASDYKTYASFSTAFGKSEIDKGLDLRKAKLSTLLVSVKDGVHNSEDYYKSLVEKNEFDKTNILMIGEKSKSKKGSSSKVFAGKNISTASYNQYFSAYIAGFQSAVSQLKYSTEEKRYEETQVSFFIASLKGSTYKKKAFAFRRGVEAAMSHPSFSPYLKVDFVSKNADDRTTGKKLYYDVSEWKDDNKIADFTGSDEFQSGDRRVMYIAGTTAGDWRGNANDSTHNADRTQAESWNSSSDFGLIGSIMKYSSSGVASKSISNLSVVLDSLDAVSYNYANPVSGTSRENSLQEDNSLTDRFERDGVKLLGTLGKESEGTKVYSELYLQAVYNLNNANYMLGKHTLYGGPLDLRYSSIDSNNKISGFNNFNMGRFIKSTRAVYSKENSESALIASSPWIQ